MIKPPFLILDSSTLVSLVFPGVRSTNDNRYYHLHIYTDMNRLGTKLVFTKKQCDIKRFVQLTYSTGTSEHQDRLLCDDMCILVNEKDQVIGQASKLQCHRLAPGTRDARTLPLHRAFSIFILDPKDQYRMLLQRRSPTKPTFPGLWSNACCSHPLTTDASLLMAMRRKLKDELGLDLSDDERHFQLIGKIRYHAQISENSHGIGWGEHELDHLYVHLSTEPDIKSMIIPNLEEVAKVKWMTVPEIVSEMDMRPDDFTPWFKVCIKNWWIKRGVWAHLKDRRSLLSHPEIVVYPQMLT